MTGSAFLPIGSYMLDMPIEGSYRYCRISLRIAGCYAVGMDHEDSRVTCLLGRAS
jgi:hypothetical protein